MASDDRATIASDVPGDGRDQRVTRFLAQHLDALRGYVRLQISPELRRREAESDLVQSVCRELLEGRLEQFEFRDEASLRRWLFGAVLNKVRERVRYHRAAKRASARVVDRDVAELSDVYHSMGTPSSAAAAREQVERMEAAFERLPEHYAHVLTLSRLVGLSHAEIAEELGTTANNVAQLLRRATVRLGRELVAVGES